VCRQNYRISVIETTAASRVLERLPAFQAALPAVNLAQGHQGLLLFVVDIIAEQAVFVPDPTADSAWVVEAFIKAGVEVDMNSQGLAVLKGVLSRKKQIIPALSA
jgi:inorganic pyrophosphatase/exopolyphosphatase